MRVLGGGEELDLERVDPGLVRLKVQQVTKMTDIDLHTFFPMSTPVLFPYGWPAWPPKCAVISVIVCTFPASYFALSLALRYFGVL